MFARVLGPWRRSSTWWTLTHLTTDVVVGPVAFCVVLSLLVGSAALLITFFLALPVIWLLFVASRGFARLERSRCAALLGLHLADPVPPFRAGSWWPVDGVHRSGGGGVSTVWFPRVVTRDEALAEQRSDQGDRGGGRDRRRSGDPTLFGACSAD